MTEYRSVSKSKHSFSPGNVDIISKNAHFTEKFVGIRRKIPAGPGEPPKDAELVEVQQSHEEWNQYLLGDGSVVKLKVVVTEVWRIENEYDADGNPVYLVKSSNVLSVTSPDQLRKPPQ